MPPTPAAAMSRTPKIDSSRGLKIVLDIQPLQFVDVIDTDLAALNDDTGAMLADVVHSLQLKDPARALAAAQAHRFLHPRNAAVANLVGALALQQKNYTLAEQALMTARRLAPNDHKIINNQACLYAARQEFARAKTLLLAGNKRTAADFAEYYYNLAHAEQATQDHFAATTHLAMADSLELLPDSIALRARMAFHQDDTHLALKILEDGLARFPKSALLHNNFAMIATFNGRVSDAAYHALKAINLDPKNPHHGIAFGITNKFIFYREALPEFVQAMTAALQLPGVNAAELSLNWQSMVQSMPGWQQIIVDAHKITRAHIPPFLQAIKTDQPEHWKMVMTGLRRILIRQDFFEYVLGALRSWYIHHLAAGGVLDTQDQELIMGLMMQNHLNEYVYHVPSDDQALINQLQTQLDPKDPAIDHLMILICYKRITEYLTEEQSENYIDHPLLGPIIQAQILAPQREFEILQTLPCLTPIQDDVSLKVQEMYMDHPYPAWVSVNYNGSADYLRLAPKAKDRVQMLVAGCGTGHHALNVALSYSNLQVTAIDLSRRSLAYAQRKTEELGLSHITYAQADILELGSWKQTFDAIECAGVLHHLQDPLKGLDILLSLLKPGGTMMIGLYSEIAREGIVKARAEIAARGLRGSTSDIRAFRQEILANPDNDLSRELLWRGDFYTVSACRDMIFHVQEHRFTLPQIKQILADRHLKFIAFNADSQKTKGFQETYPRHEDLTNLDLWHQYETKNPRTFANMYQFWVGKLS